MTEQNSCWSVWVDTGGTFTDCLAIAPSGEVRRAKVLSSSALRGRVTEVLEGGRYRVEGLAGLPKDLPVGFTCARLDESALAARVSGFDPNESELSIDGPLELKPGDAFELCSPDEAPILATRVALGVAANGSIPSFTLRLATTRGTNALLERRGSPPALFITRGFGDLLRIGTQQRPDLFALEIKKPAPLYAEAIEIEERLAADGSVLQHLDVEALDDSIKRLLHAGIESAAVALLHSHRNSTHERTLADRLRKRGFRYVCASSDLAEQIGILGRAQTAVVNAYLSPVIDAYLQNVASQAGPGLRTLHVMTSAGGLVQPKDYRAKDSLLSGPAGGVAGIASAGTKSGFTRLIGFDMGGTSTDVSRWDGDFEYIFEHDVGDAHLVAPALAIETVAAGGGSVCQFDGERLRVGPESTGASPGPACYGAGGPLSLTDVNLLLGRLNPAAFEIPIFPDDAQQRLEETLRALCERTGTTMSERELLEGFLAIANERMAEAIRRVSVRKGYDPRDHTLVAFGGAGAQHACGVAELLGITTILVPEDAGLLSAVGLGHAMIERFAERSVLAPLADIVESITTWLDDLAEEAMKALQCEGLVRDRIVIRRRIANVRFAGQDATLAIELDDPSDLQKDFERRYEALYGYRPESRPLEVVSLRLVVSERPRTEVQNATVPIAYMPKPAGSVGEVPTYRRSELRAGAQVIGPALIFEAHSATVVESGWTASIDAVRAIVLRREP
ncbi:hydantoinase/oxoprolinase family protein [bacterium]|nr:hydantoinase/oxoprolinase family protein [bacterium]